jgi:hypothetical protein
MGSAIVELGQPIRTAAIGNDPDGGGPYGEKALRNGEAHESQAEDADRARISLITPSPDRHAVTLSNGGRQNGGCDAAAADGRELRAARSRP